MSFVFSHREFDYLQQYTNEMYQSGMLRTGPSGVLITGIRNKFLVRGAIDLTPTEVQFLTYALNDSYTSSQNSIVKSQLGMTMNMLRPSLEPETTSEIDDSGLNNNPGGGATTPAFSGTFFTQWNVILACMRRLGTAPIAPERPNPLPKRGPDGDPYGVSTPMHHDINDGTGYNHR